MKVPIKLTNQTVYKCEHCGRRMLTKQGCEIHEQQYCKSESSPHMQAIRRRQTECKHPNQYETWEYEPGEAIPFPDRMVCPDCGKGLV